MVGTDADVAGGDALKKGIFVVGHDAEIATLCGCIWGGCGEDTGDLGCRKEGADVEPHGFWSWWENKRWCMVDTRE